MAQNGTEIKQAIRFLLKRYDLINAWRYVLPNWGVNIIFSLIFTVFALWFLLSVAAFSPEHEFTELFKKPNAFFLILFSSYPVFIFVAMFFSILLLRTIFRKKNTNPTTSTTRRLMKIAKKQFDSSSIQKQNYRSKFSREYLLLILLFLTIIYTIGFYRSLIFIIPVLLLVIIPTLYKTFYFSIFLPRIMITVAYVWVSFIFTEENTRYFRILPNSVYVLTFVIATFGSIAFLWFEAYQNAPSVRKSELLVRRVMPVFAYSIFFSVILGVVFETSGSAKKTQSNTIESYYFGSTLNIINTTFIKLNSLKDFRGKIENDWRSLPNISMEVGFQKQVISYPYSEIYNTNFEALKKHIVLYNQAIKDFSKSRSTDSVINQYSKCGISICSVFGSDSLNISGFATINRVDKTKTTELQKQVDQYAKNNMIMRLQLNRQDSLLQKIEYSLIRFYDTIANSEKSKSILRHLSGYNLLVRFNDSAHLSTLAVVNRICVDSKVSNKNGQTIKIKKDRDPLLYTEYPIFILGQDAPIEDFNLKRFLIQVIIAVAIGVVGQLILAEKTVTEPV